MSTGKLYQEAMNEAADLVRMAEERARDKLIESVMPRIRTMLEKRILEDDSEDMERDDDIDDLLLSDDGEDEDGEDSQEFDDLDSTEDLAPPIASPTQVTQAPAPAAIATPLASSGQDEIEVNIPSSFKKVSLNVNEGNKAKKDSILQLNESNINDLIKLMDGRGTIVERSRSIQLELKTLRGELDALSGRGKKLRAGGRIVEEFNAILRKSIGLKQEIKDAVPGPLAESAKLEFIKIEKEIREMSTKTLLKSLLAESEEKVTKMEAAEEEGDTMKEEDEIEFDMGDDSSDEDSGSDEPAEEEMTADDALAKIKDILAQVEGGDESVEPEPAPEEEDQDEAYAPEGEMGSGAVYEIDESMLRRELGRLRALREAANGASAMAHHFGGGKAGKDAFESPAKLNKNEGSKSKKGRPAMKDEEGASSEEETVKESRKNRALAAQLKEAANAIKALGRQLSEQKLFNAKLLYVNKLMQSSSLTDKQFRSIVEALDSAKNLREAHLLYTSLSESLAKPGRSLTEGARSAGGSSRPVGTASASTTLNEGAVVDRWALLAGIKK